MPNAADITAYPDEFEVTYEFVLGNGTAPAVSTNYPLLYAAQRDIIIDRIDVSCAVACGASTTVDLKRTTSGTVASPALPTATASAIASSISANTVATTNATLTTPNLDTNVIRAGNYLCFTTGAAWANTGACLITIRYRTRYA